MHNQNLEASQLLKDWLPHIQLHCSAGDCLDLACGNGRNGAYLLKHGYSVCFADRQELSLDSLVGLHSSAQKRARQWQVDFEEQGSTALQGKSYDIIVVFNYLHRALMDDIKAAITEGGYVVYETFTEQQPRFGRPKNPDFLLREKELATLFRDWHIEYYFEGIENERAFASIVARKPLLNLANSSTK